MDALVGTTTKCTKSLKLEEGARSRIFRVHKGREARQIEFELQQLDSQARPLILHLKHQEEAAQKLGKQIHRMEDVEARLSENLFAIERELGQAQYTTSKYSDSSRINNTPQRFLTKFLIVRLKDLLDHETVCFLCFDF